MKHFNLRSPVVHGGLEINSAGIPINITKFALA